TASLKNITYLERSDGKRLFLHMYQPPSADGLGAKYIFERIVGERPFLRADDNEVRFVSEVGKVKLDMRFKVAQMLYDEKLEYYSFSCATFVYSVQSNAIARLD